MTPGYLLHFFLKLQLLWIETETDTFIVIMNRCNLDDEPSALCLHYCCCILLISTLLLWYQILGPVRDRVPQWQLFWIYIKIPGHTTELSISICKVTLAVHSSHLKETSNPDQV